MVIGENHYCVELYDGSIECAGSNAHGQLWLGSASLGSGMLVPAAVLRGTPIRSFSCGSDFSCAAPATGDNKVYCVGSGADNLLGNGNFNDTVVSVTQPVLVRGLQQTPRIAQLVSATSASCVLYAAPGSPSSVQCWGFYNRETSNTTTVSITGVDKAAALAITVEGDAGCVVLQNGTVACWVGSRRAMRVLGLSSAVRIVMGRELACAVVKRRNMEGSLWCWHLRPENLISRPSFVTSSAKPQRVQGLPGSVLDAVAGWDHVCALVQVSTDVGGEVYCWGRNEVGQLGQGYTDGTWYEPAGSMTPLRVDGLINVTALYAGYDDTCAETASRWVYCWGYNAAGMLNIDGEPFKVIVMRPTPIQKLCA
jgi:alpha-tubulin suppressor-like RCC1 family protein